jgi:transcriptional regulator with XRE-family HTH domain
MPIPTPEGAVLRFFRHSIGKSEEVFAAEVGVSPHTLGRWENGHTPLPRERLEELLAPYEVSPEAIAEALRAHRLGTLPAAPGPPAGPSRPERRLIGQAAEAARAVLDRECRRRWARRHRRWAKDQWSRLRKLPPEKQEKFVVVLSDERSWALAERITAASVAAAADRADEALRLARLAVRVAEATQPESRRLHLLGYCEDFMANSLRVGGDLTAAEEAFARADELWLQGKGSDLMDLLDATRRLDLRASLFMYRERSEEARSLLDEAMQDARTDRARARLLLMKAITLEIAGEYEECLEVLAQAEPLVEAQGDRRMLFTHRYNRAVTLCHLDRYGQVERLLGQISALAGDKELDCVRLRWLEGRCWAGLGRRAEAVAALAEVRRYFRTEEIAYDFALVSLELAVLHLEQGRTRLVRDLAEEMLWIFEGQKVHTEALSALALFCQAAKAEEAQADWTQCLVKYLYRAQHNPSLRFEG